MLFPRQTSEFWQLGQQTQLQTLSEYRNAVLPPNHPTTKRVRKVAARIIEASGLGRVKSGGELGTIEGTVPHLGGGQLDPGEMLFGGGPEENVKDTEWEVSLMQIWCLFYVTQGQKVPSLQSPVGLCD